MTENELYKVLRRLREAVSTDFQTRLVCEHRDDYVHPELVQAIKQANNLINSVDKPTDSTVSTGPSSDCDAAPDMESDVQIAEAAVAPESEPDPWEEQQAEAEAEWPLPGEDPRVDTNWRIRTFSEMAALWLESAPADRDRGISLDADTTRETVIWTCEIDQCRKQDGGDNQVSRGKGPTPDAALAKALVKFGRESEASPQKGGGV